MIPKYKNNAAFVEAKWLNEVKQSANPKVIVMLSGGKDSIAVALLLKMKDIDVTAIHFYHQWSSEIPKQEAERICKRYHIPLISVNYTKNFYNAIKGFIGGRPCAICKLQMYEILIKIIKDKRYGWLCIGDNANDRTTISRIRKFLAKKGRRGSLECNEYFGAEMGIKLPEGMKVLRPLISVDATEVELFLKRNNIEIKRINSTGDKYFEYHREGCPIQFADVGVPITRKLCNSLALYNDLITKFARQENILASIHMPSGFIVTIPHGYENKALSYLHERGLHVPADVNLDICVERTLFYADLNFVNASYFSEAVYKKIFSRLLERLEIVGDEPVVEDCSTHIYLFLDTDQTYIQVMFNKKRQTGMVIYTFTKKSPSLKEFSLFNNLILELFRTRQYITKKLRIGT